MIMFNKYSVYSEPKKMEFEFYSQNWDTAQKEKILLDYIKEHNPRSLKFKEQPIYYAHVCEPDRIYATPEEIKLLTSGVDISANPFIDVGTSTDKYGYYGDETVIEPLFVKLGEEHGSYIESMIELCEQDRNAFMERLGEIAAYDLCFNNIVNCGKCYTQDFLRELLKEENSLKTLADAYLSEVGFPIEDSLLSDFEAATKYGVTGEYEPANPDTYDGQPFEERISAFHKSLDGLYRKLTEQWKGLSADESVHNALKMFSYGQLYDELKNNLGNYPAKDVYNFAKVGNVFELLDIRYVGSRILDQFSTANFPEVLQSLYPHIEPEKDIWHTKEQTQEPLAETPTQNLSM